MSYESVLAQEMENYFDTTDYEEWYDKWSDDYKLGERGEDFAEHLFQYVDEDGSINDDEVEDIYQEWLEG